MDIAACYQILGVPAHSSQKELKTAYKNLAMILHPDRQTVIPQNFKHMSFIQVQQAYQVITQERKRLDRIKMTQQLFRQTLTNLLQESSGSDSDEQTLEEYLEQQKNMVQKMLQVKSTIERWNREAAENVRDRLERRSVKIEVQKTTVIGQKLTVNALRFEERTVHAEEIRERIKNKVNIFHVVRENEL